MGARLLLFPGKLLNVNRSLDLASPEVNGENILAFSDCNIMLLVSALLFPLAVLSKPPSQ